MTKDTINKVFQEAFQSDIWKIEVDAEQPLIAIETRDSDSTIPIFHVLDLRGNQLMSSRIMDKKEWTLDSIQNGHLIIKSIGEQTPVQEGIQIIRVLDNTTVFLSYEHILVDVYKDLIIARHRSIMSGEQWKIDLYTGDFKPLSDADFQLASNAVHYPIAYPRTPPFLQESDIQRPLWLSKAGEKFVWCYHQNQEDGVNLILTLSNLNQILDQTVILSNMDKMIPQPYFQLGSQLFFMSFNKREIVSYLV